MDSVARDVCLKAHAFDISGFVLVHRRLHGGMRGPFSYVPRFDESRSCGKLWGVVSGVDGGMDHVSQQMQRESAQGRCTVRLILARISWVKHVVRFTR